ncbi:hypothetical protein TrLO_g3969 [Triparma laevis f. longispina]|uniref:Uncharacterized protein n=1 Tax=Triparma laevis f. longispina TaxID=1714387 RepID=A0A9W7DLC8_9STRA|nr:hypothetical protein TrLO_g3969 [Triparma laevis f. longispina]
MASTTRTVEGKEQQATKGLSGADIVKEDLKRQLREIQSHCDQLAKRKQGLQEKCEKHQQKIEKLKAPSETLTSLEKARKAGLSEISRLSDELRVAGVVDFISGDLLSDDQLTKRVDEIKQRKEKLKGLKEDKTFLLKTVIKLMGEEEVKHMVDEIKRTKDMPAQLQKRIPRRASTIAANTNVSSATTYKTGYWDFVQDVSTATGKRVIVMGDKEWKRRLKEEKQYEEYKEDVHATIYRDNHSIIPLDNEGIDRNHLSAGLRRDFHLEHGQHPCSVSPVVAKERLVKRVPLWSSDVATNRTQMEYRKDKTGKLHGTHTPKALRGSHGRASPNRGRAESEIEKELELIDHGVAPISPEARAKLGYTINNYDFSPYKEQTVEWAMNDTHFNIEYKKQQARIYSNLQTQLEEVKKNVEHTQTEIKRLVDPN